MRILLTLIIAAIFVVPAHAQREMRFRGSEGWGALNSRYEQLFDINNVRAFSAATVVRVDTATPPRELKMGVGMRLFVKIDGYNDPVPVHLGPMWYAINQDVSFPKDEKVDIRGYIAAYPGVANSDFIMPVEIRSKHRIFRFRDDDGNPFWTIYRTR